LRAKLFTDGGARGNPGPAGIGAYITGDIPGEVSKYIGETTNNVAEYKALISGIQESIKLGYNEASIYCDSQLVVEQVKGNYKVKQPHLKPLREQTVTLLQALKDYSIEHIPRAQNKNADNLVNKAIDAALVK